MVSVQHVVGLMAPKSILDGIKLTAETTLVRGPASPKAMGTNLSPSLIEILRSTLLQIEAKYPHDPALTELKASLVRSIAELEHRKAA
jgi:hypothetical protein